MRRRIRIIDPTKRAPTFEERLETGAREIAKRQKRIDTERTVASTIEGEIALTVRHIDRVRELHERLRRGLVRLECYIGTEIIQREPRVPVYEDRRIHERDMLRARLLVIEAERRRLAVAEEERLQGLQGRLLALMNRRSYVEGR